MYWNYNWNRSQELESYIQHNFQLLLFMDHSTIECQYEWECKKKGRERGIERTLQQLAEFNEIWLVMLNIAIIKTGEARKEEAAYKLRIIFKIIRIH